MGTAAEPSQVMLRTIDQEGSLRPAIRLGEGNSWGWRDLEQELENITQGWGIMEVQNVGVCLEASCFVMLV